MKIIPYLFFEGDCESAMNFYKYALNGEIVHLQRYKDTPMEVEENQKEKIVHGALKAGENEIYFSDVYEYDEAVKGKNIALNLNFDSEEEQTAAFNKLSEESHVEMKLQDTFWGARFGSLVDKYGIRWMLNFDRK